MKRIVITIIYLVTIVSIKTHAQNVRFVNEGVIEFERSTNVYSIIQKSIDQNKDNSFTIQAFEQLKKTQSQFKISNSTLYFSKNKTLFVPAEDNEESLSFFSSNPSLKQINTVYNDLSNGQQVTRKNAFEEIFIVKDSARVINWKLTSEIREIAGYSCRRANALIMDSIYVVAFYAEEIPVYSGPESFTGLPGMILGVALPHECITWFAKTVTDKVVDQKILVPPFKGKATDKNSLIKTLNKVIKSWGSSANSFMKDFLL